MVLQSQKLNKFYTPFKNIFFIYVSLTFLIISSDLFANSNSLSPIGFADETINEVFELKKIRNIKTGDQIFPYDIISTNTESLTNIEFKDGTILSIGPESEIIIDEFIYDFDKGFVDSSITITQGFFRFIGSNKKKSFKFSALGSVLGIRGTIFDFSITNNKEFNIAVYEGNAILINKEGLLFSIPKGTAVTLKNEDNEQDFLSGSLAMQKIQMKSSAFPRFKKQIKTKNNFKKNLRILNSNKIKIIGQIDNFKSNNKNKSAKEQNTQSRDLIDNLLKDNQIKLGIQNVTELKKISIKANMISNQSQNKKINDLKTKINNGPVTFKGKLSGGSISNKNNSEKKVKDIKSNRNKSNENPQKEEKTQKEEKPQKEEKKKK